MSRMAPRFIGLVALLMGVVVPTWAGYDPTDTEGPVAWREMETEMPAFPRQENLREIYVSAVATNRYLVDPTTLTVGGDGVVRYVLVVLTGGGATNVSLEGMHCKEGRWKHYATGHADGRWVPAPERPDAWRPIENKPVNRHHAALSREFFCPGGVPIHTAEEGRDALRRGKHPYAK